MPYYNPRLSLKFVKNKKITNHGAVGVGLATRGTIRLVRKRMHFLSEGENGSREETGHASLETVQHLLHSTNPKIELGTNFNAVGMKFKGVYC